MPGDDTDDALARSIRATHELAGRLLDALNKSHTTDAGIFERLARLEALVAEADKRRATEAESSLENRKITFGFTEKLTLAAISAIVSIVIALLSRAVPVP